MVRKEPVYFGPFWKKLVEPLPLHCAQLISIWPGMIPKMLPKCHEPRFLRTAFLFDRTIQWKVSAVARTGIR